MTSDRVVGQGRRIRLLLYDLSFRNESELDECLEAIADTEHESVTLI